MKPSPPPKPRMSRSRSRGRSYRMMQAERGAYGFEEQGAGRGDDQKIESMLDTIKKLVREDLQNEEAGGEKPAGAASPPRRRRRRSTVSDAARLRIAADSVRLGYSEGDAGATSGADPLDAFDGSEDAGVDFDALADALVAGAMKLGEGEGDDLPDEEGEAEFREAERGEEDWDEFADLMTKASRLLGDEYVDESELEPEPVGAFGEPIPDSEAAFYVDEPEAEEEPEVFEELDSAPVAPQTDGVDLDAMRSMMGNLQTVSFNDAGDADSSVQEPEEAAAERVSADEPLQGPVYQSLDSVFEEPEQQETPTNITDPEALLDLPFESAEQTERLTEADLDIALPTYEHVAPAAEGAEAEAVDFDDLPDDAAEESALDDVAEAATLNAEAVPPSPSDAAPEAPLINLGDLAPPAPSEAPPQAAEEISSPGQETEPHANVVSEDMGAVDAAAAARPTRRERSAVEEIFTLPPTLKQKDDLKAIGDLLKNRAQRFAEEGVEPGKLEKQPIKEIADKVGVYVPGGDAAPSASSDDEETSTRERVRAQLLGELREGYTPAPIDESVVRTAIKGALPEGAEETKAKLAGWLESNISRLVEEMVRKEVEQLGEGGVKAGAEIDETTKEPKGD